MPICGGFENPAENRCHGKQAHRSMYVAESIAQRYSLKQNELLIAYECFDCGYFHLGHADQAQLIVRQTRELVGVCCPRCKGDVPEERRIAAASNRSPTVYCSKKCKQKFGKKRRAKARAERELIQVQSETQTAAE